MNRRWRERIHRTALPGAPILFAGITFGIEVAGNHYIPLWSSYEWAQSVAWANGLLAAAATGAAGLLANGGILDRIGAAFACAILGVVSYFCTYVAMFLLAAIAVGGAALSR